jgi:hypothetical protein
MANEDNHTAQEPYSNYGQPVTFDQVWKLFMETDKKFKETDRLLTDKFQETDRKFQETDKKIKELANLFTTQWGKLVESLVEPACLQLFQSRGIEIGQSYQNVKARHGNKDIECDIVLVNSVELVVVEVKTTFRPEDVNEFTEKLATFKVFFPQYKGYNVLGATAALKYEGQSDKYAYRQGLFVLRSTGEGIIKIVNDNLFVPKAY